MFLLFTIIGLILVIAFGFLMWVFDDPMDDKFGLKCTLSFIGFPVLLVGVIGFFVNMGMISKVKTNELAIKALENQRSAIVGEISSLNVEYQNFAKELVEAEKITTSEVDIFGKLEMKYTALGTDENLKNLVHKYSILTGEILELQLEIARMDYYKWLAYFGG